MKKLITILLIGLFLTGCSLNSNTTKQPEIKSQTKEMMLGADSGAGSPGTMADNDTVGTVVWNNPNNAKVSDNVYATTNLVSIEEQTHYLKATNFGFSIPAGATINGILVEIEKKANRNSVYGYVLDNEVLIVKSDDTIGTTNKYSEGNWPLSDTYTSHGASDDLWDETWTQSDINNTNFGVVVSLYIGDFLYGDVVASIDHIRITVYYTEGGSSSSCTYSGSGDWYVLYSDNCNITTEVSVAGGCYFINDGAGWFGMQANINCMNKSEVGYGFNIEKLYGSEINIGY